MFDLLPFIVAFAIAAFELGSAYMLATAGDCHCRGTGQEMVTKSL